MAERVCGVCGDEAPAGESESICCNKGHAICAECLVDYIKGGGLQRAAKVTDEDYQAGTVICCLVSEEDQRQGGDVCR